MFLLIYVAVVHLGLQRTRDFVCFGRRGVPMPNPSLGAQQGFLDTV